MPQSTRATVLVLGAGGGVGNLAVQLAHHAGARVLGAGRDRDRGAILEAGASTFVDLAHQPLPNPDEISLVFDTVGGQTLRTVADALNGQSRVVSIVDPAAAESVGSRGVFFVVEPDRDALTEIATQVDTGSLRPVMGRSCALSDGRELIEAKDTSHVSGKVSLVVR